MWLRELAAATTILAGTTPPAAAATIYLECTLAFDDGKSLSHLDVTLNEDAGNAGFVIRESGWSPQKMTAAFTPSNVTFRAPSESRFSVTTYSVSRTDLSFVEETRVGEKLFRRSGNCKLAPNAERKF